MSGTGAPYKNILDIDVAANQREPYCHWIRPSCQQYLPSLVSGHYRQRIARKNIANSGRVSMIDKVSVNRYDINRLWEQTSCGNAHYLHSEIVHLHTNINPGSFKIFINYRRAISAQKKDKTNTFGSPSLSANFDAHFPSSSLIFVCNLF